MVTSNRLRPQAINSTSTVLMDESHSHRADGLKTGETDTTLNSDGTTYDTRTPTWNFDALDRLTQEKSVDAGNPGSGPVDLVIFCVPSNIPPYAALG